MVRYLIKFSKGIGVKFISHLELMRCVQRSIRRSGIPVSYSKGFNPHTELSFATPLPVGTWSVAEYMEIKLETKLDEESILSKMNEALPFDIKLMSAYEISDRFPALMSLVEAASYEIRIVNIPEGMFKQEILDAFVSRAEIEVIKSNKKGHRNVNIKPMIYNLKEENVSSNEAILTATVATGSKSNLNPELLMDAMKIYLKEFNQAEIRDIKKTATYVKKDGEFVTLIELAESDCI